MPASSPPRRQRPLGKLQLTHSQLLWIELRDAVGAAIDTYLATRPPPEMRTAVEGIEDSLRVGDHASGLTA